MQNKGRNIAKIVLGVSIFATIMVYLLDVIFSHSSPFKFLWLALVISITCLITLIKLIIDDVKDILEATQERYIKDIAGAFDGEDRKKKSLIWAVYFFSQAKYTKSIELLKRLEEKCEKPGDYRAIFLFLALSYANLGQDIQAIYTYEKAIKNGYGTSNIYNNLGHLYAKNQDTKQAHDNYDLAIYYDSTNVAAYYNKAQLCFKDGNRTLALELLNKALEINPTYRPSLTLVAVIYALEGKNDEAIAAKGKAIENGESAASIDRLILYYKNQSK